VASDGKHTTQAYKTAVVIRVVKVLWLRFLGDFSEMNPLFEKLGSELGSVL